MGVNLVQLYPNVNWNEVVRLFHMLCYYGPTGEPIWETTTWMGAKCQKLPFDAWLFQEIIHRTRPQVILETGIRWGGSTLFMANLLDLIGEGQIMSVDVTLENVAEVTRKHPRVTLFEGSSTDETIVAKMADACRGKRTMVVLDSDHSAKHVLREMELYGPLVTPGCYMIVEDTNVNGHPVIPGFGPGPMEALQQYLASHASEWKYNPTDDRLLLTFHPRGFLVKAGETPTAAPQS